MTGQQNNVLMSWEEWSSYVLVGVGSSRVDTRFHPTDVRWNLGLSRKFPTPVWWWYHILVVWSWKLDMYFVSARNAYASLLWLCIAPIPLLVMIRPRQCKLAQNLGSQASSAGQKQKLWSHIATIVSWLGEMGDHCLVLYHFMVGLGMVFLIFLLIYCRLAYTQQQSNISKTSTVLVS